MKVLIFADSSSMHTIRWANALRDKGIETAVLGLSPCKYPESYEGIKIYSANISFNTVVKEDGSINKFIYFKSLSKLKKIISDFKPDILHSYYASSYGFIGALVNFHPFYISAWGSDVFTFPRRSIFSRFILKYSLSKADRIFSTSKIMAKELKKYSSKYIHVIPFGVDLNVFIPNKKDESNTNKNFVIGTIKSLEEIYGIENLIRAFKLLNNNSRDLKVKLLIVGEGTLKNYLKNLCNDLQISDKVEFTGRVSHPNIVNYLHRIDIAVFLSKQESFGVSVIEAMACEIPVIVSKADGFKEIVENEENGIFVDSENLTEISDKISKLIFDENLRSQLGANGKRKVEQHYNWNENVAQMINVYHETINLNKS